MAGKPSAAQMAAKKHWERAPADKKPSARELAAKHNLAESSVHRAAWWIARNQKAQESAS